MGAKIKTHDGKLPFISGSILNNSKIQIDIPLLKNQLILAALNTKGTSYINEQHITRDHTEIMLESFGADIEVKKMAIALKLK